MKHTSTGRGCALRCSFMVEAWKQDGKASERIHSPQKPASLHPPDTPLSVRTCWLQTDAAYLKPDRCFRCCQERRSAEWPPRGESLWPESEGWRLLLSVHAVTLSPSNTKPKLWAAPRWGGRGLRVRLLLRSCAAHPRARLRAINVSRSTCIKHVE